MKKKLLSITMLVFAAGLFAFTLFACAHLRGPNVETGYRIYIGSVFGGAVSVQGGLRRAEPDTTITLNITENPGYRLHAFVVSKAGSGEAVEVEGDELTRTFTMPPADINIMTAFLRENDPNPEIDGIRIGDYVPGVGMLIWRDEFLGTELDRTKWNPETGTGIQYGIPNNWGNNELQWYSPDNVWVEDGYLIIEVREEHVHGWNFTSARITTGQTRLTAGGEWTPETFHVTTGRVEGRMKTPRGRGFWPAFWLLGSNSYGPVRGHPHQVWPLCAEIDIMEFFGGREYMLVNAIHFGPHWPYNRHRSFNTRLPGNALFSDDFHIYGVEWDETEVRFMLNGDVIHRITYADLDYRPGASEWMQNFFNDAGFSIILNIATGGNMGLVPPSSESFNGVDNRLTVDWVRVFSQ